MGLASFNRARKALKNKLAKSVADAKVVIPIVPATPSPPVTPLGPVESGVK